MARLNNNNLTGVSGRVGNLVFSQRNGKTILSIRPKPRKGSSPKQITIQEQFKKAARYAKEALSDPNTKQFYQSRAKGSKTAHNVAVADFMHAPSIGDIDGSLYDGNAGVPILVSVTDEGKVLSVQVRIETVNGMLVEEGDAKVLPDGGYWQYTTRVVNASFAGSVMIVTAKDMPGNTSSKHFNL